jgi:MFS family permease
MHRISFSASDALAEPSWMHSSIAYRRYILAITFIVLSFSYMDRQIIGMLLPAIKVDLKLSDTALGLLSGMTFALFYATLGLPVGRLADNYSRRDIVAISLALWSAMTAMCGTAHGFMYLFLSRMGVGVGEAGATPASFSMLADYVPKERRATAYGIAGGGAPFGAGLGLVLGGWAVGQFGWRAAFLIAGLPGILLATIYWLTVREPVRNTDGPRELEDRPSRSVFAALAALLRIRSYRSIAFGLGFFAVGLFGLNAWMPTFLMRTYGMRPAAIGLALGASVSVAQLVGGIVGGRLADSLARRDLRWQAWMLVIVSVLALPCVVLTFAWPIKSMAFTFFTVNAVLMGVPQMISLSMTQLIVPSHMRSIAVAFTLFLTSLIGQGIGPLAIGGLSDLLASRFGPDGLRFALLASGPIFLIPALLFLRASRTLRADAGLSSFSDESSSEGPRQTYRI